MTISEKLTTIAQNQQAVYDAGYAAGQEAGGDTDAAYEQGVADGKQAEYDRFWDAYQNGGRRKNYQYAFSGRGWAGEIQNIKYPIAFAESNASNRFAMGMCERCITLAGGYVDFSDFCSKVDFSGCLSLNNTFQNAMGKNISVNAVSALSLNNTFRCGDGGSFDGITLTVSAACTSYSYTFYYCTALENLTFTEGSVVAATLSLAQSPLNKASIESVMTALSTETTGTTLTLNQTAVNTAFETSEGAADGSTSDDWLALVATKSNWTISLA